MSPGVPCPCEKASLLQTTPLGSAETPPLAFVIPLHLPTACTTEELEAPRYLEAYHNKRRLEPWPGLSLRR